VLRREQRCHRASNCKLPRVDRARDGQAMSRVPHTVPLRDERNESWMSSTATTTMYYSAQRFTVTYWSGCRIKTSTDTDPRINISTAVSVACDSTGDQRGSDSAIV
jgi:hypothetical protein